MSDDMRARAEAWAVVLDEWIEHQYADALFTEREAPLEDVERVKGLPQMRELHAYLTALLQPEDPKPFSLEELQEARYLLSCSHKLLEDREDAAARNTREVIHEFLCKGSTGVVQPEDVEPVAEILHYDGEDHLVWAGDGERTRHDLPGEPPTLIYADTSPQQEAWAWGVFYTEEDGSRSLSLGHIYGYEKNATSTAEALGERYEAHPLYTSPPSGQIERIHEALVDKDHTGGSILDAMEAWAGDEPRPRLAEAIALWREDLLERLRAIAMERPVILAEEGESE